MKKYAVILGLVFTAFLFASCKLEKGGTIEVINDHTDNASIYIMKGNGGTEPVVVPATAGANGGTATFSIDEDGDYTVNAIFYSGPTPPPIGQFTGHGDKKAHLSGGNKEIVHVMPN